MRRSIRTSASGWLCSALASVLAGCVSISHAPRPAPVQVPPVVDLAELGALGMLEFAAPGGAELAPAASQQFLAALQSAQPGTPVLELGAADGVLASVRGPALDPETVQAIGAKYRVDALLVGELETHPVKPRVSVRDASALDASAEIEGVLRARILDTRSGATVWTTSAQRRVSVAQVQLGAFGVGSVDADRPAQAREELVRALVEQATADFHPRWRRP